ncbi:MAG: class I SAM-dependent methyltransferase [Candidatus Binataceae bacterium]
MIVPTREGYDRWAEVYDSDGNPLVALEDPEFARMIGEVRGLRIADVGTGTGRHALRLAREGARVVALDLSLGMMARAKAKPGAGKIAFICADCVSGLPLPDASFDRVVSGLVAEHVPDLDAYLAELARVCRRDGFIIVTNVHPAMNLKGVRARFTDPATGAKVYPQGHDHTISDFVMAARRTGLRFDEMIERTMTTGIEAEFPRAERYVGWPMLLAMRLSHATK